MRTVLLWIVSALTTLLVGLTVVAPADPSPPELGVRAVPSPVLTLQPPVIGITTAIQNRLLRRSCPALGRVGDAEQRDLDKLYELQGHTLLWIDSTNRASRNARLAISVLDGASADGLDPHHYGAGELRFLANALDAAQQPLIDALATFDVCLSGGMLRYFRHLHLGRVDPRSIGFRLRVPSEGHDFVALLSVALANDRIVETAAELAPPLGQYQALRRMLARYRALATNPELDTTPVPTEVIRPGEHYVWPQALHWRLIAFGDLPFETPFRTESPAYEGAIVDGVKRFQLRHGLADDGVLGRQTQAALAVPIAWRVKQIELALERLRWLPDLGERRLIALNIPMFQLWTWDSVLPTGEPSGSMPAIVGRALSTQTPVFAAEMREVIFRPYWNVPRSILQNEILPVLERAPDYLRRNEMEMVRGSGDDARPMSNTAENIALLRQGVLRLRQRPGPQNALGLAKFVFPNDADVYMHGTPAQELFKRSRRDFSHGCVRVQDPLALAEWVLSQEPAWTRERILGAMSGTTSLRVKLTEPIDVVLFYTTAAVTTADGTIRFAEDIYRHDAKLDRALRAWTP